MPSDDSLSLIKLYKGKLLKYLNGNEEKVLYYIKKLDKLPLAYDHLEITKIGIIINRLSHEKGVVGRKASALVKKWKQIVRDEEEREAEREKTLHSKEEENIDAASFEPDFDSDDGCALQIEESEPAQGVVYGNYQETVDDDTDSQNGYNPHTSREDYLLVGHNTQENYIPSYSPSKFQSSDSPISPTHEISNCEDSNLVIDSNIDSDNSTHQKTKAEIKENKTRHREDKSTHKDSRNKNRNRSERHKHKDERKKTRDDKNRKGDENKIETSKKGRDTSSSKHSDSGEKDRHKHRDKKDHKHGRSKDKSKEHKRVLKDAPLDFFDAVVSPKKKPKESSKNSSSHNDKKSASNHSKDKPNTKNTDYTPSKKRENTSQHEPSQRKKNKDESNSNGYGYSDEVAVVPCLLPSYKPLPKVPEKPSKKGQSSNEEGLNFMFSLKKSRQRTLYTGNPGGTSNVASLEDLCIKFLLENIDVVRGITLEKPFQHLLERANPKQLQEIEYFNPDLLEETGYLWELQCKKLFKSQKRQEMETWRDMFERCTIEYQEKLDNVTKILERKFVTKAEPKRTTQLAYVNPNQKQVRSLAKAKVSTYNPEPERLPKREDAFYPQHGSSKLERLASKGPVKKTRMAPLMAKTLQLHKKICRR